MADTPFNIIDKNPRKPLKEGLKAQEAYCEDLANDWDRDMVAEAKAKAPARDVPDAATVARYAKAEAETRDRFAREAKREAAQKADFVTLSSGLIVPGRLS